MSGSRKDDWEQIDQTMSMSTQYHAGMTLITVASQNILSIKSRSRMVIENYYDGQMQVIVISYDVHQFAKI